jgi:zona occludens toxin
MITLVTGAPGTGKTAFAVSQLLELPKDRPLFVHGVPDLKIPHESVYCKSRLCDICTQSPHPQDALYVEEWNLWAPDAAILVLDEVQRIWRPRASSVAPPDSVQELEYHRHRGLDFIMMTQGPHLMDSNVRRLVGRHIHIVAKWAGRFSYEWPECKADPQTVGDAVKRPYRLPKQVFDLYHSATVHTKHDLRKPLALYALGFAILAVALIGYRVSKRISEVTNPAQVQPLDNQAIKPEPSPKPEPAPVPVTYNPIPAFNPTPDFTPRSPGRIESAPAYDGTYTIKPAPILTAAVYNKATGKCTAFARGGRRYPTTQAFCIAFAKGEADNLYKSLDEDKPKGTPELITRNVEE